MSVCTPCCSSPGWGSSGAEPPREEAALSCLILFLAGFLARPFPGQRGFDALLLARLQIEGVSLDLFDDVLLLHFALEAAKSVLEGFALLQPNFGQTRYTPRLVL